MVVRRLLGVLLILAFTTPELSAGQAATNPQRGNWDALAKLKVGARTGVVRTGDSKEIGGTFVTYDQSSISVRVKKNVQVIPREEVQSVVAKSGRRRGAAYFFLGAACVAVPTAVAANYTDDPTITTSAAFGTLMGFGALSVAIAATARDKPVYSRPVALSAQPKPPVFDEAAWQRLRRVLPASLRGSGSR